MLKVDLSAQYQEFSNHNWGERERAQTLCWFNSPDKAFPRLSVKGQDSERGFNPVFLISLLQILITT